MKIAVVGTGYVGLSNAILLPQHHEVISLDIDLPPINHLQSVRIKLLTIGEIHEDPKTAVQP